MSDIHTTEQDRPTTPRYVEVASATYKQPFNESDDNEIHLGIYIGSITDARTNAIVRGAGWIGSYEDSITSIDDLSGSMEKAIARAAGGLGPFNDAINKAKDVNSQRQTAILTSNTTRESLKPFGQRLGDTVITNSGNLIHQGVQRIAHVMCHNTNDHSIDANSLEVTPQAVMYALDTGSVRIRSLAISGEMGTGVGHSGLSSGQTLMHTIIGITKYLSQTGTNLRDVQIVLYDAKPDQVMKMLRTKMPGVPDYLKPKFTKK
jgi:hypothetical protein